MVCDDQAAGGRKADTEQPGPLMPPPPHPPLAPPRNAFEPGCSSWPPTSAEVGAPEGQTRALASERLARGPRSRKPAAW